MLGGIIMAVILVVVFPVMVAMGCAVIAFALGSQLTTDGEARFEGSELLECNR